jgi:hypothetical protein
MSEAKIDIKIGHVQFSGEGEQDWVAKQLDKILAQAEKLMRIAPEDHSDDFHAGRGGKDGSISNLSLANFLNSKNAQKDQMKKFVATAIWLHAKGTPRLEPKDVTKALADASQKRLGNPRDILRRAISKGLCDRQGRQFYVTDIGKENL